MRCPKCHYLSFDPEPRCKNCGYDLEVADGDLAFGANEPPDGPEPELQLREPELVGASVTLDVARAPEPAPSTPGASALRPARRAEAPRASAAPRPLPVVEPPQAPQPIPVSPMRLAPAQPESRLVEESEPQAAPDALEAAPARRVPARAPHTTTELPLFVKNMSQREPVIDPEIAPEIARSTEAPRPPLSVRRPSDSRPRAERRVGPIDHDLLEDLRRVEREEALARAATMPIAAGLEDDFPDMVPASVRAGAAALDGLILGGIAAFVFWAVLRLAGVGPTALGPAALVPLGVFLGLIGISYLLMFTVAGGQTVGKMLMGIRVVGEDDSALTLPQATSRALLAIVSVGAVGLGWLPAFFGRGLALHDRLAHTRVVRA